ncbi:hypothetical protein HWV62_23645 [Athelia sp. TMB]|nr:hypothetical protein HWV62_23645 [Athelia sp. TMB]
MQSPPQLTFRLGGLSTLGENGTWPASEVDYTAGCKARRANWPAQTHWIRITAMAAAWYGDLPGNTGFAGNETLRNAISLAMGYWFSNDFTDPACLDFGGSSSCPCDTPGLWNTNWYSNVILIPGYVGQTCLLLNFTLLPSEVDGCSRMILRAYGTFGNFIRGIGFLTGANTLDVAKIGLDQGLRASNISLVTNAYARVHAEVVIHQGVSADGIRPDGSFGQHNGILYNGNYGKTYLNDELDLETEAIGTQFGAGESSQQALETLLGGNLWMMYRNIITGVLHWDFVSTALEDGNLGVFELIIQCRVFSVVSYLFRATGSINFNINELQQLAEQWQSDLLLEFVNTLKTNSSSANSGDLVGNRMFYDNDYMPFGFHLSDGTVYTHLQGDEYEDIAAAWDWNLISGTTTDYAATPLNCTKARWIGVESFVGGVSDDQVGIAAMRYTNPYTGSLSWQKTWFFLENDVQFVMVANINSTTTAPLYSILDQKRHVGAVYVDGSKVDDSRNFTMANMLWHAGVGYSFEPTLVGASGLSVEIGEKSGSWQTIGVSTQPNITVDLFTAYIVHSALRAPIAYSVYPATLSYRAFKHKRRRSKIRTICNNAHISAIIDDNHSTAMVVFWDPVGGTVTIPGKKSHDAAVSITSSNNSAIIYQYDTGNVTVSDPSQSLTGLQVTLEVGMGKKPPHWGWGVVHTLAFDLPTSGSAGSSVSQLLSN